MKKGPPKINPLIHYIPEPNSGCWLWMGACNQKGYGQIRQQGGKRQVAHRVIYELLKGPIPERLTLDHLCRMKICVNPNHLEIVTLRENILRGNGIPAQNARKTHCLHGHLFDDKNTVVDPNGHRRCKKCSVMKCRRYVIKRKILANTYGGKINES